MRQELPWVRVDKEYRFETDEGTASLADLFRGRSQLLIYHFMFGPEYEAGCPSCSAIADSFNGSVPHLVKPRRSFYAVSRAPLAKLQAYEQRMGWSFPWASSFGSDFNYDYQVARTEEQQRSGNVEYNFRPMDMRPALNAPPESWVAQIAHSTGPTWRRTCAKARAERFVLKDGVVYHTYSAYARGVDATLGDVPVARPRAARPQQDGDWCSAATTNTSARNASDRLCRKGRRCRSVRNPR